MISGVLGAGLELRQAVQSDFCHVIPPWIVEDAESWAFSGKPSPLVLVHRFLVGCVFLEAEGSAFLNSDGWPFTCGYAGHAGQERCSDNLSNGDGDLGSYIGSI